MMYKNNFIVVVKSNGRILRETNGEVYLPFGAEYSILLKNKNSVKASVEIEVDGQNVLNGHNLIVDANTSQEIKGFMRDMNETNKFKFIKKTKQIQDHRGDRVDDGLVRVKYQFEKSIPIVRTPYIHKSRDLDWPSSFQGQSSSTGDFTFNSNIASYACCNSTFPTPEEGITVKGDKIDQGYQYGSIGFLEPESTVIILHLKGEYKTKRKVLKPLATKTILTCETCGTKSKSNKKFCSNCGTYLR